MSEATYNCQLNLVQAFVDKVIKKHSVSDFVGIMNQCSSIIGPCDMDLIDIALKEIDLESGWSPAALVDLHAVRFFGSV
eukprot:9131427-Pyramimonas_sp.AAC.1